MSKAHIDKFIQDHADWIRKHQAQASALPPVQVKNFISGEYFLFLGKEYPLIITSQQKPSLVFSGFEFHLTKFQLSNARQVFTLWYKAQARRVISQRVVFNAKHNYFTYQKIRISSARTRWGSCSSNGTLSFTWRLVMAPPEVLDYVVLHELVHTKIKNHSRLFWEKLGEILPDYKVHVRWLKQNGKYLNI
jgi:predicted metal-dependent hydrolase